MMNWIVYNVINFFCFGAMVGTKTHIQYVHLGFEPESLGLGMLLMLLSLLNTIRVLPILLFLVFLQCCFYFYSVCTHSPDG